MDVDLRCGHCGREGLRDPKGQVVLESRQQPVLGDSPWAPDEVTVSDVVQVDLCKGCGNPTLLRFSWVEDYTDAEDLNAKILYPEQRELDDLPGNVRKRYSEMLQIQHEPDLFAVRAGKCLEAICADLGVPRTSKLSDLAGRLDALVDMGELPESLAAQAHIVREYRNIGGHDAVMDVKDSDAPLLRRFVEGLLDFFYWGPKSLDDLTARFQLRKKVAEGALARKAESKPS